MTTNPPQVLPEALRPLARELALFYRELPGLLRDRQDGKYFVAKEDTAYGVWDTLRDALQYGHEKFPDGVFLAQKIDARFLTALAPVFGPQLEESPEVA